jgi:hypothetical protein
MTSGVCAAPRGNSKITDDVYTIRQINSAHTKSGAEWASKICAGGAFPFSMHLAANAPYLLQWLGKERRFNAWLIALRLKFSVFITLHCVGP